MPPLVGRLAELETLGRALGAARLSAQIVQLTGEPWIGKTRLLAELAARARGMGWTVLPGRATRSGGGVPFEVVVDALDDHLARHASALSARLDTSGMYALSHVFPALGAGRPGESPPDTYLLLRAIRMLLEHLAGSSGLLLVLDDVHRAGPLSWDLLDHLLRHPPDAPVLIALARRGPTPRRQLAAPDPMKPHTHLRQLEVGPLSDAEAAALLPVGLDAGKRREILEDAAGVPGLLHALGASPLDFHALSPLAWQTACAAAVAGGGFTPELLARVAQLPRDQVLRGIDELRHEGLVQHDDGGHRFRFRRPVVRSLIHDACDAGWLYGAQERAAGVRQDGPAAAGLGLLSRREAEIASLVSEGCTNQQIAGRLLLSPKTVETYLSRIFKKLGIGSRAQIAHLVGRGGDGLRTVPSNGAADRWADPAGG